MKAEKTRLVMVAPREKKGPPRTGGVHNEKRPPVPGGRLVAQSGLASGSAEGGPPQTQTVLAHIQERISSATAAAKAFTSASVVSKAVIQRTSPVASFQV
ncbi:hypothetical protein GCM10017600_36750 [Streptosporangium carneum]|uniref:Uncharacterized protein n=1 Tax=Streptosporangium carneum TaxID=47481 RepID=A0A9W6MD94_9ACTN|nr:hypothetical protein GCM10017600_36750 [Streptosporangium carneum]